MKEVVLSVSDPRTQVSINHLGSSGHKFIGIHQPNGVAGLIGDHDEGNVIYNLQTIETSMVLSPGDANGYPTIGWANPKEVILNNLDGWTWYQVANTKQLCEAYIKLGL